MKQWFFYFLLSCATAASAGTVKEYNADLLSVDENRVYGKIYVTEGKIRLDYCENPKGRCDGSLILRADKRKIYLLDVVNKKKYLEMPLNKAIDPFKGFSELVKSLASALALRPKIDLKKIATETVNGYTSDRFLASAAIYGPVPSKAHLWIAPEFSPVPLRAREAKDGGMTVELRNIEQKAQPFSLFETPSGYSRDIESEKMLRSLSGPYSPGGKKPTE